MTVNRRAAKRDGNEGEIIKALRDAGATVHQLSAKGVPDLLIGYKTHNILIEVKMPGEGLTEAQETWHQLWRGTAWVVWNVSMALNVLETYDELDRMMMQ